MFFSFSSVSTPFQLHLCILLSFIFTQKYCLVCLCSPLHPLQGYPDYSFFTCTTSVAICMQRAHTCGSPVQISLPKLTLRERRGRTLCEEGHGCSAGWRHTSCDDHPSQGQSKKSHDSSLGKSLEKMDGKWDSYSGAHLNALAFFTALLLFPCAFMSFRCFWQTRKGYLFKSHTPLYMD